MIVADTSAIVALMDSSDGQHKQVVEVSNAFSAPLLVPMAILSEIAFVTELRLGTRAMSTFLKRVRERNVQLDRALDSERVEFLIDRYNDLRLGFSDACVIACAEANGGNVLTLDRRDFDVVAAEGTITVHPDLTGSVRYKSERDLVEPTGEIWEAER